MLQGGKKDKGFTWITSQLQKTVYLWKDEKYHFFFSFQSWTNFFVSPSHLVILGQYMPARNTRARQKLPRLVVIRQHVVLLTAKFKPPQSFRQLISLSQGSLPHFSKTQNTFHALRYLIFCKEQDRNSLISELRYCEIWKSNKRWLRGIMKIHELL